MLYYLNRLTRSDSQRKSCYVLVQAHCSVLFAKGIFDGDISKRFF